jgi:TolB-like protein
MIARLLFPLCLFCASYAIAEPMRVAVFDFEMIDTSLDGEMKGTSAEEKARLAKLAPELRTKLAASDRFVVVDTNSVNERAHAQNLQACGGCDATLAHEVGADVALTGTVQKVSNLILNINIYLRDAKDDRMLQAMSADIRGNTDESWSRGLSYLIRNKLLAEPAAKQ